MLLPPPHKGSNPPLLCLDRSGNNNNGNDNNKDNNRPGSRCKEEFSSFSSSRTSSAGATYTWQDPNAVLFEPVKVVVQGPAGTKPLPPPPPITDTPTPTSQHQPLKPPTTTTTTTVLQAAPHTRPRRHGGTTSPGGDKPPTTTTTTAKSQRSLKDKKSRDPHMVLQDKRSVARGVRMLDALVKDSRTLRTALDLCVLRHSPPPTPDLPPPPPNNRAQNQHAQTSPLWSKPYLHLILSELLSLVSPSPITKAEEDQETVLESLYRRVLKEVGIKGAYPGGAGGVGTGRDRRWRQREQRERRGQQRAEKRGAERRETRGETRGETRAERRAETSGPRARRGRQRRLWGPGRGVWLALSRGEDTEWLSARDLLHSTGGSWRTGSKRKRPEGSRPSAWRETLERACREQRARGLWFDESKLPPAAERAMPLPVTVSVLPKLARPRIDTRARECGIAALHPRAAAWFEQRVDYSVDWQFPPRTPGCFHVNHPPVETATVIDHDALIWGRDESMNWILVAAHLPNAFLAEQMGHMERAYRSWQTQTNLTVATQNHSPVRFRLRRCGTHRQPDDPESKEQHSGIWIARGQSELAPVANVTGQKLQHGIGSSIIRVHSAFRKQGIQELISQMVWMLDPDQFFEARDFFEGLPRLLQGFLPQDDGWTTHTHTWLGTADCHYDTEGSAEPVGIGTSS
ncbi:uncharacterized protein EV422DRAFT_603701 [Fimicolochytrium jonesii]|uniref:uncharacterized protein n=1 Tax=Fimicolochytrium jonesii TaxID=1396493 RepID=UPI0022FEF56A|nr:uncharacterized protein EV422DRAFT_603701 [Fimicolochytrium jonesii]KAI8817880.1 hypothetical protein EV422DRAFT_603701 [Fimicolochytrium jonesii]